VTARRSVLLPPTPAAAARARRDDGNGWPVRITGRFGTVDDGKQFTAALRGGAGRLHVARAMPRDGRDPAGVAGWLADGEALTALLARLRGDRVAVALPAGTGLLAVEGLRLSCGASSGWQLRRVAGWQAQMLWPGQIPAGQDARQDARQDAHQGQHRASKGGRRSCGLAARVLPGKPVRVPVEAGTGVSTKAGSRRLAVGE